METNNKQSRLEEQAFESRKTVYATSDYYNEDGHEYGADHDDARYHEGDRNKPLGKGNGVGLGVASLPGETKSRGINYSTMDTKHGGGSYDVYGVANVPKSGRIGGQVSQLYNSSSEYGPESVDTSLNQQAGQYVVGPAKRSTIRK